MVDMDKLYYIKDYNGNYYSVNDKDDLVTVRYVDEAAVFTYIEANKRLSVGNKKRFYLMAPVDEVSEVRVPDKTHLRVLEKELDSDQVEMTDKDVKSTPQYDISKLDWEEFLTHFTYVIESLGNYKSSLIKAESDVDLEICDILHYIELCDVNDDEAARLIDLLRECREHRREVKDEIVRVDTFQRTLGNSSNVVKAKEALKAIKGLENRRYTPRKLSELFENSEMRLPVTRKKHKQENYMSQINEDAEVALDEGAVRKETEDMEYVRRDTVFDGRDNDWMAFAVQQAEFYRNVNQYIINIKLDIEDIDDEIANLMDEIDASNCNVTQGYKMLKHLKELRNKRKEKEKELECLYILTERFDVAAMTDECESNVYEMEKWLYPNDLAKQSLVEQNQEENEGEACVAMLEAM